MNLDYVVFIVFHLVKWLVYIVLGIVVIILWLIVDYAYRTKDEVIYPIVQIVGIASFVLAGLISFIKGYIANRNNK